MDVTAAPPRDGGGELVCQSKVLQHPRMDIASKVSQHPLMDISAVRGVSDSAALPQDGGGEIVCQSSGCIFRKRLRVLCLHGFRTSASILQQQLFKKWDNSMLNDFLDLAFLDAPFPCNGKSDVEGIFAPPYYEWFQYNIIFTVYTGLEDCIQFISDFMQEHGPFDGLLGFSQGAVLCAALAGLQQKGLALTRHPALRFVLIISGAMLKNVKMRQDCYSDIIRCPSVHFIGTEDWLKPKNEELREVFEDPIIIRHGSKHTVPKLDEEAVAVLKAFLGRFQVLRESDSKEKGSTFPQYDQREHEGSVQEDHLPEIGS